MPKVLILLSSGTGDLTRVAESIAGGAESVKFTEVELRRLDEAGPADGGGSRYRTLESPDAIADYDALIIGVQREVAGAPRLRALVEGNAGGAKRALTDKVATAFTSESRGAEDTTMSVLAPLLRQGMILVAPLEGADLHAAHHLGARVAKVAEWIRHAKSHEHGHSHAHGHSHSHPH